MSQQRKPAQAFETTARPPIALAPVESNKVQAIGYDEMSQTLAVTFRRGAGAVYHYHGIPREIFEAFTSAQSKGRFFKEHLQDLEFKKYPAEAEPALAAADSEGGEV